MTPVLILTHGNLATELLAAGVNIDPDLADHSSALSLPWDIDSDAAATLLEERLRAIGLDGKVLILTDMFGGTATNLALPFLEPGRVEIVTGVNLPMLVKLASLRHREPSPSELAEQLTLAGQKSIRVASQFLRPRPVVEST